MSDAIARTQSSLQLGLTGATRHFTAEYLDLLASRLRVICLLGVTIIPGFFVIDLAYADVYPDIPLPFFAFLRGVVALYYLLLWVVLRGPIGTESIRLLEWFVFPPTCILTSYLGLDVGGIDSPYYAGVMLVALSRNFLIPGTTLRAAAVLTVCWACYPATLGMASLFRPEVAAQWSDPIATGAFVGNNVFIFFCLVIGMIGAVVINRLQLKEYQLRRIGRYRIIRQLGEGGMGVVYLGSHGVLKGRCAIKLMGRKGPVTPTMRIRFEQEARHTAMLSHPNTIQIFDFGASEDGQLFYAMEFVEGADIRRIVETHGPMEPRRAVYLIRQACRSTQHAHTNGVIHRDLKPENCMVAGLASEPDFLKVLDFGLAKLLDEQRVERLDRRGAVLGTPHYMAPELCEGKPADARSDIYSLGGVLFYMLTGRPVFRADSWMEVMLLHTSEPPTPPSRYNREVRRGLDEITLRCLAKRPSERFQTAEELERALMACPGLGAWDTEDAREWWILNGELPSHEDDQESPSPRESVSTTFEFSMPDSEGLQEMFDGEETFEFEMEEEE